MDKAETEKQCARRLANRILDRVSADPDDDLATLSRQLLRADEEIARLKERFNGSNLDWVAVMLRDGATIKAVQAERDQARAERDAAVECLRWYADFDCEGTAGDEACNLGKRARACLVSLPHAAARAQAQLDVIAAVRTGAPQAVVQRALERLDALESGGGEHGR